LLTDRALLS